MTPQVQSFDKGESISTNCGLLRACLLRIVSLIAKEVFGYYTQMPE
jgi:hypothetical protein